MAVMQQERPNGSVLRVGGGFTAIFSLAMGLLILFAIPSACSFVGSIQLLMLGFLFIIGILAFILGQVLTHKHKR